jgi:hypothetical protein
VRRFELFLLYGQLFAVGWPAVFGVRPRRGIVSGLLVVSFGLHWQLEGLRWQLIPLYGLFLGLLIGDVIFVERNIDWTRRIARGVFGIAGVLLASLFGFLLPVPELPIPSGPSDIGTFTVELVDVEREEVYGEAPGGPRRLNVQVWYPADLTAGSRPGLWSDDWDVVAPAMSRNLGFPGWFLNHTRYVTSHAHSDAPISAGTRPVVIYSHGWTGFRTIAVNQVENLASNGYIVIAADHTYGAIATRFEDGEVVGLDPAALPDEEEVAEAVYADAAQVLVGVYADDLVSILDALDEGADGPFARVAGHADLTRIGLYGHSTGGGAAVRVCLEDDRCDAVLGMDAWVEPIPDRVLAVPASKPALYMRSDEWRGTDNDAVLRGIADRSTEVTYWLGIEGAGHNDFVVTALLSPVADRLGLKGPIPGGRIVPIIDRYLSGFFDVFLLDAGSAALETASFPEVALEVVRSSE